MIHIPDLVGYPINEAIELLKGNGLEVEVVESMGKHTVKTEDARVIRQKSISTNKIELIISFF